MSRQPLAMKGKDKTMTQNFETVGLTNRIKIVNARFAEEMDMPLHVAFDVAVDGEIVGSTLEWLDEDDDLVRIDNNLDVNTDILRAVSERLDEDYDDVYMAALQLLKAALEELKEPQLGHRGDAVP